MKQLDEEPCFDMRRRMLLNVKRMTHRFAAFSELQDELWQAQFELKIPSKGMRCDRVASIVPFERRHSAVGLGTVAPLDPSEPLDDAVHLMACLLQPLQIL